MPNTSTLLVLLSGLMLMFSGTATVFSWPSIVPPSVILALSFFAFIYVSTELYDSESAKTIVTAIGFIVAMIIFFVTEAKNFDSESMNQIMESITLLSLGLTIYILGYKDLKKSR